MMYIHISTKLIAVVTLYIIIHMSGKVPRFLDHYHFSLEVEFSLQFPLNVHTVFTQTVAVATINFSSVLVWLLIESGYHYFQF